MCGFWTISRVFYTLGYSTGDAKKVREIQNPSIARIRSNAPATSENWYY